MSETELHEMSPAPESELDEDDRLKPAFVSAVLEAVESGNFEAAHALVEPLHPADIADLVEFHGNDALVTFLFAGKEIGALVKASACPKPGDAVAFAVEPEGLHLFDRESGISLLKS